ncbi:unnamed protein product [Taenia asiatica]|uniref:DoxX family protein n=1 Tax=Taenia asiatica TaxID=60517 RepID=A0A0R3WGY2_TAEAS|nr:unnamed protein product [Taenia asiatica]
MSGIVKALTAPEMRWIFALIYFHFAYQQWIRAHRRGQWVRRIAWPQWIIGFGKYHFVTP